MKTFVYILLLACNVFFLSACNESTEIEVLAPTPTTGDEGGSNVEFTPEQLKLPYKKGMGECERCICYQDKRLCEQRKMQAGIGL